MKLYKYSPSSVLTKMFERDGFTGLKCAYPESYNDPFELFLSVDTKEASSGTLAYYKEVLGEIPQMPTSCFSKRPDVVPMWAHYGNEHSGYVIEIDEELLKEFISIGYIEDVTYSEATGTLDLGLVNFAATTCKPRHTHRVQTIAFSSAYFTKNRCWEYELERRLVANPEDITNIGDIMILYIPNSCITALISGAHASSEDKQAHAATAEKAGCKYLEMKIGRSSCIPYFTDADGSPYLFQDAKITPSKEYCASCLEPTPDLEQDTCDWCSIDDADTNDASFRNPFRMMQMLGVEHKYGFAFADFRPVGRNTK